MSKNPENLFTFLFEQTRTKPGNVPTFSGHGSLQILLRNDPVWGQVHNGSIKGIDGYWDNLLHHLAKAWPFIQGEETYPLGLNPPAPDQFLDQALANLSWDKEPDDKVIRDEQEIITFSDRHNLAAGMPDLLLPPIFFIREGKMMRIVAEIHDFSLPLNEATTLLEDLGNTIAQAVDCRSPRGSIYLDTWIKRDEPLDSEQILSLTTGISPEGLLRMAANDDLTTLFGRPSLSNPTPMQIAARMIQHRLFDDELRQVLDKVVGLRMSSVDNRLIELQKEAFSFVEESNHHRSFEQGYLLAQWLRQKLNLEDHKPVDPEGLLHSLGVSVANTHIAREIDAIARWDGERMGILVNRSGLRAKQSWGRRASLAHEMAHLLVDTHHVLPSVEILGGRMPLRVEQRANAFAAEFLLPRSQVTQAVPDQITPATLKSMMENLANRFSVGHLLAARQIQNHLKDQNQIDQQCQLFFDRIAKSSADMQSFDWLAI
ncbi:MAG: ImmA/IrrE family metallo-endopeptidase [Magnetococcales bacterium]|nr:ImmA/IrrE family metallo-endopeptidase [Magnetococcales bacterium]